MGDVLKAANAAIDDSHVHKSFAAQDDVWLTLSVAFTAEALALWTSDPTGSATFSGDFAEMTIGGAASMVAYIDGAGPGPEWIGPGAAGGDTTAGEYHLLELHWERNVTREVFVDGTSIGATSGIDAAIDGINIGQVSEAPLDPDASTYIDDVKVGTTRGGSDLFADDFESGGLSAWDDIVGEVSVTSDPFAPPPPPPPEPEALRGHSYRWRYVVTDLDLHIKTILDHLATGRKITYTLNKPAVAVGTVPADNPEVNIPDAGIPYVDEGVRLLFAFRHEGDAGGFPPWRVRFAGIILQIEDNVSEDQGGVPYTNITAYDPWQYLYSRPLRDADGEIVGPAGLKYTATPAQDIVTELLARTQDPGADGNAYIDASAGTVEACDPCDITFQQGTTVGEAWEQLCESGFVDIVLTPIYDTTIVGARKIAALNVYASPHAPIKRSSVFAWDRFSRSLVGLNRLVDGTQRANRLRYYGGEGESGPAGEVSDATSQAKYGDYWAEQFFPGANVEIAEALAEERLIFRRGGTTTYRVDPAVGGASDPNAPVLFFDYFLGSQVPIYASARFRKKVATLQRVYEIPVDIRDDGVEQIAQMTFSDDGLGE